MKKFINTLLLVCFFSNFNFFSAFAATTPPSCNAEGVVILNAQTGEILYEKNKDNKYYPASPTKLMTALLTLENCNLDEKVTVNDTVPNVDGSKIYLDTGEVLTVKELLYSLIMVSANDSALALAEHISGSVDNFAKMMNDRAKKLGCKNTNFTNPHGLCEKEHKTTAYDLALIERELLKNPIYLEISKTESKTIPPTNKFKEPRPLWNDNRLLHKTEEYYYSPCIAAKTGYTDEALHSFVASAKKGNETFIIAMLRDPVKTYFKDSKALFEWAFENFKTEKVLNKNEKVKDYEAPDGTIIPVLCKSDLIYTKNLSSNEKPEVNFKINNLDNKSILHNQVIGYATFKYKDKEEDISLISGADYIPKKFPSTYKNLKKNYNNVKPYFKIITGIVILVIILLTILFIKFKRKRLKRKKLYFK